MMEESSPRAGTVDPVSSKSKRVNVNNLHLPPYPSEESLSRRTRWYIAHPYLSTAILAILLECFYFAHGLYMGKSVLDALIGFFPTGLGVSVGSLVLNRYRHRLYHRPYRRDD